MSTATSPGCVILLIDESSGMGAVMGEVVTDGSRSTKTNAERVATAVNSLLNQVAAGPDFELALVGYKTDSSGQVDVACRWAGGLAGREFVRVSELAAAPVRVETRTRKIPSPGGVGLPREESVSFPVWYEPALGVKAPQIAAYDFCRGLLERWGGQTAAGAGQPLVVHVSAGSSGDGNPEMAVRKLMSLAVAGGNPLLLQAHLAASAQLVSALYPSTHVYLTVGSARDMFRRASPLPAHLMSALRSAKVTVQANARGLLYNAKVADLIRLLGLVKSHAATWAAAPAAPAPIAPAPAAAPPAPSPAAEAPPVPAMEPPAAEAPLPDIASDVTVGPATEPTLTESPREKAALVVLLLDRSVEDPFSGDIQNPCAKLQDQANDLLRQVGKLADGAVDAAIVSYGQDPTGQTEVRSTFDGPLAGQTIVPKDQLAAGPLRVDEFDEEMSNGIGGLVTVHRKKPIYLELEPTGAASPLEGFLAAADVARQWSDSHPAAALSPIVLHLTRGRQDDGALRDAVNRLADIAAPAGPVSLYHLVATESPHKSVAYPEADGELDDPALRVLWEVSSPLLGAGRLAAEKPTVKAGARGLVVNGKFDLLLDEVKHALAP
jgi:hypothetical protein